jgi:hypothetical protein
LHLNAVSIMPAHGLHHGFCSMLAPCIRHNA